MRRALHHSLASTTLAAALALTACAGGEQATFEEPAPPAQAPDEEAPDEEAPDDGGTPRRSRRAHLRKARHTRPG